MRIVFEEIFPEYVHVYGNVISIPIIDTDEINLAIDKVRASDGKQPLYNRIAGWDEIDLDGWYEVRLIIDRKTYEPLEIEAWVVEDSDDDAVYHLEIEDKTKATSDLITQISLHGMRLDELEGLE